MSSKNIPKGKENLILEIIKLEPKYEYKQLDRLQIGTLEIVLEQAVAVTEYNKTLWLKEREKYVAFIHRWCPSVNTLDLNKLNVHTLKDL